jgi:hypothetical protein
VIEPIPHADEADVAEQARPVEYHIEQCDALPDLLGDNRDAETADHLDQRLPVSSHHDDHPPAAGHAAAWSVSGGVLWPAWQSDSFTSRRSFIRDMASRNQPYRPDW